MTPIPPEYIQAWRDRVERDLGTARAMLDAGIHDACALYCQQAVEKMLKAWHMVKLQQEARKTHKIVELAEELGLPQDLVDDLHDLESDYIQARYPDVFFGGGGTAYDDAVARERMATAEKIIEWLKERLEGRNDDGGDSGIAGA